MDTTMKLKNRKIKINLGINTQDCLESATSKKAKSKNQCQGLFEIESWPSQSPILNYKNTLDSSKINKILIT